VDSSAIVAAKTEEGLTGRTVHPVDGQVRLSRAGRRRLDRRSVAVGQRVPDLVHLRIVHVLEATSHLKQPRQQNPPSTSAPLTGGSGVGRSQSWQSTITRDRPATEVSVSANVFGVERRIQSVRVRRCIDAGRCDVPFALVKKVQPAEGNIFGGTVRCAETVPSPMGAIPGNIETDQQPPMTVPLRHFVVGLAFLVAGIGVGIGLHLNAVPGLGRLAHLHLLLAGWICITIMGAMTQFVPVWSGATLHSRRLANVQLGLVVAGLTGFVVAFLRVETAWLIPFATLMLVGFWAFAYNIIRTLATVGEYDVTERHFLGALGFFLALTVLGLLLAIDFTIPTFSPVGVSRSGVVGAHATLAVFGAVLTTVYGALYQLGTMFTQTELHGIDHHLRTVEEITHPTGVVVLAVGRLVAHTGVARVGDC